MYLLTRFPSQLKGESVEIEREREGGRPHQLLTPSAVERPLLAHKMLLGLRIRSGLAARDKASEPEERGEQGREEKIGRWKAVPAQFMVRSKSSGRNTRKQWSFYQ